MNFLELNKEQIEKDQAKLPPKTTSSDTLGKFRFGGFWHYFEELERLDLSMKIPERWKARKLE